MCKKHRFDVIEIIPASQTSQRLPTAALNWLTVTLLFNNARTFIVVSCRLRWQMYQHDENLTKTIVKTNKPMSASYNFTLVDLVKNHKPISATMVLHQVRILYCKKNSLLIYYLH